MGTVLPIADAHISRNNHRHIIKIASESVPRHEELIFWNLRWSGTVSWEFLVRTPKPAKSPSPGQNFGLGRRRTRKRLRKRSPENQEKIFGFLSFVLFFFFFFKSVVILPPGKNAIKTNNTGGLCQGATSLLAERGPTATRWRCRCCSNSSKMGRPSAVVQRQELRL